jgi:hypothetical protein
MTSVIGRILNSSAVAAIQLKLFPVFRMRLFPALDPSGKYQSAANPFLLNYPPLLLKKAIILPARRARLSLRSVRSNGATDLHLWLQIAAAESVEFRRRLRLALFCSTCAAMRNWRNLTRQPQSPPANF